MMPDKAKILCEEKRDFNLSNKFEYGLDKKGGIEARQQPISEKAIEHCYEKSAIGWCEREENKEKIYRQNFTIQPAKELENTETKYIGTHKGKGIENVIDIDDLKRSHLPIAKNESYPNAHHAYKQKSIRQNHIVDSSMKNEYQNVRFGSKASKIPFSPEKRNRLEKKYEMFDKINGYGQSVTKSTFKWQVPTYDLNP